MPDGKYTANEVEERTGVPATTLRQWERRYGVPKPERARSGYRLYSDADMHDIRAIKAHITDGVPASRAAEMVRDARPVPDEGPRPLTDLRLALVEALVALDEERAELVLAEAHAIHVVDDVVLEVMRGAIVDIGTLWHDGAVTTATEHFASGFLQGRLRQLMSFAGHARSGPAVLVACAPHEQHEIGAMMLAVMLRRSGFQVYYVGANTPVEDLAAMAARLRPAAVAISASSVDAVHGLFGRREHLGGMAPVLAFGGSGFNADPRRAELLGGVFLADNVKEGVARLHDLIAALPPEAAA
jgi:MerR family transcriptional regulator, light-induced transcriptional regulator